MIYVQLDAVFADAAVFGDTNLELPSVVSNRSIVEVHMSVDYNIVSGQNRTGNMSRFHYMHVIRYVKKNSGFSLAKKVKIIVECTLCLIKSYPKSHFCCSQGIEIGKDVFFF